MKSNLIQFKIFSSELTFDSVGSESVSIRQLMTDVQNQITEQGHSWGRIFNYKNQRFYMSGRQFGGKMYKRQFFLTLPQTSIYAELKFRRLLPIDFVAKFPSEIAQICDLVVVQSISNA